jgi:hypothetical protein
MADRAAALFAMRPDVAASAIGRSLLFSDLCYLEILAMSTTCPGGGGFSVTGLS